MTPKAAELVAGIIDRIEGRPYRTGRPPLPTITVVETLRFFVREGVQWRELRAAAGRACGSTLRRRLDEWSGTALLRRVHAALVRMVRSGPEAGPWDVVVDSCPARAERGGEPTGPDPTDRGEAGTGYHVVVATDGLPPGVVPSAADVHDSRLFPRLPRPARVVCAAIGKLCADAALACGTASSLASGRSARRTARGPAPPPASSSTVARGCWPTSGRTGATTGWAGRSWRS